MFPPLQASDASDRASVRGRLSLPASPAGSYQAAADDDGDCDGALPGGGVPSGDTQAGNADDGGLPDGGTDRGGAIDADTIEVATRLDGLRAQIAALTGVLPDRADPDQVDAWLASFRRVEGAVAGLRSRLVGCAQKSHSHAGGGHASQPSYLKEVLGISGREAARQSKLARDLRRLPGTRDALAAGEIGPEQAQAIGRSARGGVLGDARATEEQLLPLARRQGPDELSREIRRREQEADRASLESAERRAHRRRRASLARRNDGMWDLHGLLPDEQGEALATALDAFRTFDPPGTPIQEERSPDQRTADALAEAVAALLRSGKGPRSGGVLPQLNVVVPLEALDPDGAVVGELAHGGVLSPAAIERLLCDANLRRLVTRGDNEVLDVGRSRREWSVAQRQALRVRDGGCRGPGCDRPPAWTHAHHLVPWEDDGPTSVDNGMLLCSFHHHQVHEGGWTVRLDLATAAAHFCSPTGREVTTHPHRPAGPRSTRRVQLDAAASYATLDLEAAAERRDATQPRDEAHDGSESPPSRPAADRPIPFAGPHAVTVRVAGRKPTLTTARPAEVEPASGGGARSRSNPVAAIRRRRGGGRRTAVERSEDPAVARNRAPP